MTAVDARADVERLVHEYGWRLDNGDFAGVGELFAHARYGAVLGGALTQLEGAEAVEGILRAMVRTRDGRPLTRHVATNLVVDVDGDRASARSYFTVIQQIEPGRIGVVMAGHYLDRFERVDGTWRFADRVIHAELEGDTSAHLAT